MSSTGPPLPGVSFVLPVHNGERCLAAVLDSILAEHDHSRPFELLIINDGSSDRSLAIMRSCADRCPEVRVLQGQGRGAAAAINLGIQAARHPLICQVDQDVMLEPGWLHHLTQALQDPAVAAAQGYYRTETTAPVWERLAGYDLELRYAAIAGTEVDHCCTGNSVYRVSALQEVGLLDERLGYGYDNDLSYRLTDAGFRLVFCRQAVATHRWRATLGGYLHQQYGLGYGRLDLISKHRRRVSGDQVSGLGMILHVPLLLLALLLLVASPLLRALGGAWQLPLLAGAGLLAGLALERLLAGLQITRRFHDPAGLLLPAAHLLRDLVWVWALLVWSARRLCRHTGQPWHSMARRR